MEESVFASPVELKVVVKAFLGGKEFDGAKIAIDHAAQEYTRSMGFLTATMTAKLLFHDKSDRRQQILTWVWTGDYWKRPQLLRSQRVPSTGDWFLECEPFQKWKSGGASHLLISLGIRTVPAASPLTYSWGRKVIYCGVENGPVNVIVFCQVSCT